MVIDNPGWMTRLLQKQMLKLLLLKRRKCLLNIRKN